MTMSKVTTIRLDEQTAKIADNIPNLSEFVRHHLRLHAGDSESSHYYPPNRRHYLVHIQSFQGDKPLATIDTLRCNPFSKKGTCLVCWPVIDGTILQQVEGLKEAWLDGLEDE